MSVAPARLLVVLALVQQAVVAGPVRIHAWPEQRTLATRLAAWVEEAGPLPALPDSVLQPGPVDVFLAPDRARWDSLTGGAVPEWGAGVADPLAGRIVIPTFDWERTPPITVYRTLRHELAHVALQRHLGEARTPRWFTEGYAQWAAGEWDWDSAWRLRLAFLGQRAPPLDSLSLVWPVAASDARVAYLLSASAVGYLVDRSGERGIAVFLDRWAESGDFHAAFRATYGVTMGQFEEDWRRHVKSRYGWPLLLSHSLVFWLIAAVVLLLLFQVRRRRDRARLARLRETEPPDDPAFWDPPAGPPAGPPVDPSDA